MAINENINLNVTDGGTIAGLNKEATKLSASLAGAANSMKAAGRVASPIAYAKAGVANVNAIQSGEQIAQDSNLARGVMGQTGAAGRNFSNQAQGLGGLVHVYATFAANIWALSAAFTHLSKAADISNMIKGLDQLGASSGKALGSLAKRLADVAGGAISLTDAMSATALASSGGLTGDTIIRLGNVARQASQALGRSMPDAMERLTKGIVKVQPELLDELGIMTRVLPAQHAYALEIGKSVSALTDFEKRQAFANAVLAEGEKKFGSISLQANPYSKVLASIQNLIQSGLELVNKVLGPIVSVLSESPTALALALAAMGSILLKQAIPSITAWRKGLEDASKAANQAAIAANALRKEKILAGDQELIKKEISLTKQANQAYAELSLNKQFSATTRTKYLPTDLETVTNEQINALEKRATALDKMSTTNINRIAVNKLEANTIRDMTGALKEQVKVSEQLDKIHKPQTSLTKATEYFSQDQARDRIAESLTTKARISTIVSGVAEELPVKGTIESFKSLGSAVKNAMLGLDAVGNSFTNNEKKLSIFSGVVAYTKGSVAILTNTISTLVSSLSVWFAGIGLLIGAFQLLDSWLSTNSKEASATSSAFEALRDSGESVSRTLDNISKKDPLAQISTESITAKANALNELSSNIVGTFDKVKAQAEKASWWDLAIDTVKADLGLGLLNQSAKEFSFAVSQAIKVAQGTVAGTRAQNTLKAILGFDPSDVKKLEKSLSESPEKLFEIIPRVETVLKGLNQELNNTASKANQLDTAFTNASKALDELLVSAIPTDPLAKVGLQAINIGKEMGDAFKDPLTQLNQLVSISTDLTKVRFLGTLGQSLFKDSKIIKDSVTNLQTYEMVVKYWAKEEQRLLEERNKLLNSGFLETSQYIAPQLKTNKEELDTVAKNKALGIKWEIEAKAVITPFMDKFKQAQDYVFSNGAKLLESSISIGFAKAALIFDKAMADTLGDTLAGIEAKARVQLAENSIQIKQIDTQLLLIKATEDLRLVQEELLIEQKKIVLKEAIKNKDTTAEDIAKMKKDIADREIAMSINKSGRYEKGGMKDIIASLNSKNDAEVLAAQGALGAAVSREAMLANKAQIAAQNRVIKLKEQIDITNHLLDIEKDRLSLDIIKLNNEKAILDLKIKGLPFLFESTLQEKQNYEEQAARKKDAQDLLNIQKQINAAQITLNTPDASKIQIDEAKKALLELNKNRSRILEQQYSNARVRSAQYYSDLQANELKLFKFRLDIDKIIFDTRLGYENNILTLKEENLTKLSTLEAVDKEYIAEQNMSINFLKERIRHETEISNIHKQRAEYDKNQQQLIQNAKGLPEEDVLKRDMVIQDYFYTSQIANEDKLFTARTLNISIIGQQNIELERQASIMNKLIDLTNSLGVAFGTIGKGIGEALQAIQSMADIDQKYLIAKKALQDEIAIKDVIDPSGQYKAQEQLNKLEKKHTQDVLSGYAAEAKAVKGMFAEKTFAAKTFAAIENIIHVKKIANYLQEALVSTTTGAVDIAASLNKAFANAKDAISSAFAMKPQPLGFIAGATMIGIMASLLGKAFGGGGATAPGGFTSAEQQKIQGTGQSYVNGTLTDNGGGKLGDAKALSTTITDGIARLEKVNYEMLDFDRGRTYKALVAIRDNTENFVKSIGVTNGILGNTSQFGTVEGSSKVLFGLFSSSVSIQDKGIEILGSIRDLMSGGGTKRSYENVTESSSFLFGLFSSSDSSTKYGKLPDATTTYLKKMMSNFKEVLVDSAKELGRTTDQVSSAIDSFNIQIHTSSKDLSGTDFANAVMAEIGIQLDLAAQKAFPDLTRLSDQFQHFGESTSDFVIRLVSDSKQVQLAFNSIGKTLEDSTTTINLTTGMFGGLFDSLNKFFGQTFTKTTSKAELSQMLVGAAGSLDNFVTETQNFSDAFLTDAERLAPVQKALGDRLAELGYSSIDTRDKFKQLILGFKVTDQASADMYVSLLGLSKAFDAVYAATKKTATAEELRTAKLSQLINILNLEGKTGEALVLQRLEELSTLDDSLKAGQLYLYALQDEASIKAKLKTAYDKENSALNTTITSLKSAVKTLNDFKNSLLVGADSILTPLQKYEEAALQFGNARVLAMSNPTATDTAGQQAKSDALAQLTTLAGNFLSASKVVFASSSNYTMDFNSVLDVLSTTSDALSSQQTDAEKQLAALNENTTILDIIKDNTGTTADLLSQLTQAQTVSSMALQNYSENLNMATAELMSRSGLTEELMKTMLATIQLIAPNIQTAAANYPQYYTPPGATVTPNQMTTMPTQSNTVGTLTAANDATAEQIKVLTQAVNDLASQQQQQTADLIATNYAANQLTADAIAAGFTNQQDYLAWVARMTPGYIDSIGGGR